MLARIAIAAFLLAMLPQAVGPARADGQAKFPDWSGQWKKPNGVGNQWDLSRPPGRGQRGAVPDDRRLALVGDADAGRRLGSAECLPARRERRLPDALWQVLHPAGVREILAEFLVSAAREGAFVGHDESRHAGRAGVDRERQRLGDRGADRLDIGPGDRAADPGEIGGNLTASGSAPTS